MEHPKKLPSLLFADGEGNIREFTDLEIVGMSNGNFIRPALEDWILLPEGSDLFALPGRLPVGWDPHTEEPVLLTENPYEAGKPIQAVAAFMAPAHTAFFSSSLSNPTRCPDAPTVCLYRGRLA